MDWRQHWNEHGQSWRTEPEITAARQLSLQRMLSISPDPARGLYPFSGERLSRADVEWLLTHHDDGRGPVVWSDRSERDRVGLDLRGANLSKVNLANLPLARLRAGLAPEDFQAVHGNQLGLASRAAADLREADLFGAHLEGATLQWDHLEGASLELSHLDSANLEDAYLTGTSLRRSRLHNASLRFAVFDVTSNINLAELKGDHGNATTVADTNWNGINLALIDWHNVRMLGDEQHARRNRRDEIRKTSAERLLEYRRAVRANRQLSVALFAQGAVEEAAHSAYRAQRLQRVVFRREKWFARYLFNAVLDAVAGFGYRPSRTVLAYVLTIVTFSLLYLLIGSQSPVTHWHQALVLSLTSFHGRGFLSNDASLGGDVAGLAAAEAVFGLVIEATFVATFAQRFLGR